MPAALSMAVAFTDEPICQPSEGIEVRVPRDTDAASLSKHASDPAVWAKLSDRMPQPYTLQDARDFISMSRHTSTFAATGDTLYDKNAPRIPTQYAIIVKGEACGVISLVFHEGCHRVGATLGYWLGTAYQYQGIMSKVVPAFVEWTWKTFGYLLRLNGTAYEFNVGSQNVMKKAGFTLEGVRINACIKLGVVHNEVWLAAIRPGVQAFQVT